MYVNNTDKENFSIAIYPNPTKESLILAIYDKMRQEASASYSVRKPNASSLQHFHHMIAELEEFQYRYRFFNLDILEISRSFPRSYRVAQ